MAMAVEALYERLKIAEELRKIAVFGRFVRYFGRLTEISSETFRPILTENSAEISVSVVH